MKRNSLVPAYGTSPVPAYGILGSFWEGELAENCRSRWYQRMVLLSTLKERCFRGVCGVGLLLLSAALPDDRKFLGHVRVIVDGLAVPGGHRFAYRAK